MNTNHYANSAGTKEANLPAGWTWVPLGTVCEIIMGQSPSGDSYNANGQGEPLLNGPTEFGTHNPRAVQWTTAPTRFCEPGDILLCVRGNTTGRKNIADRKYCIGRGLGAIRGKSDAATTDFLWFALEFATERLLRETSGSTFPNLPRDKLLAVKIPLPSLVEQRRLAALLQEQLAEVARARAAVSEQMKAAGALRSAVLRAVFQEMSSANWPRRHFGEICQIVARQVNPMLPEYRDLPHVNGENIESGVCRLLEVRSAAEDGMISGKYLFEAGDVLYSKLRPYLRKVVLAEFRGLCSADMYPLRIRRDVLDPKFTAWMLAGDEFTKYAVGESQRSRMPKLNREQLFAWEAPIPDLIEQRRIVAKLDQESKTVMDLRERLREKLASLNKLPAVLLSEAFSCGTGDNGCDKQ